MTGSASSQADPFQFLKKNHTNLDNISEKSNELSDQNTISEQNSELKSKESTTNINNNNDQPQPSVEKILFINQSIRDPSFYKSNKFNTSFLNNTNMKDSDFNMSLTNVKFFIFLFIFNHFYKKKASAFDWKNQISAKIEESIPE